MTVSEAQVNATKKANEGSSRSGDPHQPATTLNCGKQTRQLMSSDDSLSGQVNHAVFRFTNVVNKPSIKDSVTMEVRLKTSVGLCMLR